MGRVYVPKRSDDGELMSRAQFVKSLTPESKVRWVFDYRHVNSQQEVPRIPLPNIDALFDRMKGAQWFFKLDLATGYHQMLVEPESRKNTAFKTHSDAYEWLVAPMGMPGMPGMWSRLMQQIFGKLTFAVVYMDDICRLEDHGRARGPPPRSL